MVPPKQNVENGIMTAKYDAIFNFPILASLVTSYLLQRSTPFLLELKFRICRFNSTKKAI